MSTPEPSNPEENAQVEPAAGERLRLARETLKLTVQDVAEKIRIDIRKVEALESGDVDAIGAPVFAAGYIRAYARIVALPGDELIAEFEGIEHISSTGAQTTPERQSANLGRMNSETPITFSMGRHGKGRKSLVRWVVIALLLAVAAAAALWFLKSGGLATTESADGDSGVLSLPENTSSENMSDDQTTLAIPGQDAYVAAPESIPESETMVSSDEQDASPVVVPKEKTAPAETASQDELTLQFQDDSWVEVHDAQNNRLIHQLAHAGQVHALQGVSPFSLVLGYVPGVTILLNGETVDLSKYQGRRLAHLTVGDAGE